MSSFDAYLELVGTIQGEVLPDEKLSRHCSYRIGGPADLFITLETYSDLTLCLDILKRHQVPWVVLGKGSNLLVADEGYRGAVLVLGREFNKFSVDEKEGQIVAGAAVVLARVVQASLSASLSGLESLVGVPGTLGGALAMNAGTRDLWIAEAVESLVCYRPNRGLVRYHVQDINWSYRATSLPQDEIILEAVLRLKPGDEISIRSSMEASLSRRKKTQPLDKPSCGSVFRNPEEGSAARMIDKLGMKGMREGDAQISELHANFIVNNKCAAAQDVLVLMKRIQERVSQEYGVELTPEVKFLGFK